MRVEGADQLARLSRHLKEAANKDLQRELSKAISKATKPVKDDIKQSARGSLPSRGGLAARAARGRIVTRRRNSRRESGVRIVSADRSLSLWHLNQGMVRHRQGGDINAGKVQRIPPGFWDKAVRDAGPPARRELERSMQEIIRKIGRRV